MNKLMNKTKDYVFEILSEIKKFSKNLNSDSKKLVIFNKHNDKTKVNLIFGGGVRYEPAYVGYVGKEILLEIVKLKKCEKKSRKNNYFL